MLPRDRHALAAHVGVPVVEVHRAVGGDRHLLALLPIGDVLGPQLLPDRTVDRAVQGVVGLPDRRARLQGHHRTLPPLHRDAVVAELAGHDRIRERPLGDLGRVREAVPARDRLRARDLDRSRVGRAAGVAFRPGAHLVAGHRLELHRHLHLELLGGTQARGVELGGHEELGAAALVTRLLAREREDR